VTTSNLLQRIGASLPIALAFVLVGLFIGMPTISVLYEALRGGLHTFLATFAEQTVLAALGLTLSVTLLTVACTTVFGVIAAWTITKYRFPFKAFFISMIDVPLSVSPVVAGLAVLLAYGEHGPIGAWLHAHGMRVAFAFPGIVLATTFVTFPYVARELGAVSVISGHIQGVTTTVPLDIEILYNDGNLTSAFSLASVLAILTIALSLFRSYVQRARKKRENVGFVPDYQI
jgi:sulfate transport system permease protein